MSDNADLVQRILTGQTPLPQGADLTRLVSELKADLSFSPARKVLARIPQAEASTWVTQQLALCTYKDEELPPSRRLGEALAMLERIGLRDEKTTDAETLSLGGAIYKRKWEYEGQLEHLYQSLGFYHAAWQRNPRQDLGYGGLNAAFVLDLLASRAEVYAIRAGMDPRQAQDALRLRGEAETLRREMLAEVPRALAEIAAGTPSSRVAAADEPYWQPVTMAEIHFGLRDYKTAGEWLARARRAQHSEWHLQTTYRQLVAIARSHGVEPPAQGQKRSEWHPAWQALYELLAEDTGPALSCWSGKVGLALSGGGFRASLFHLGVLARMAETDALRSVEVLSTVSGGSIVGAHYYLELQRLLQTKRDEEITRDDYIRLVQRLIGDFLAGVERNLRTRALANLVDNFKFVLGSSYTRSHRMGELYERELYRRVPDSHPQERPRTMPELLVQPADPQPAGGSFKPKFSNWRRRAKVPVMLLNTTSLNSGHAWQFTARWMGEPPGLFDVEVDANPRYRRLWYEQAPAQLQSYRLGHAVAASACVPGLFEPLTIQGLYDQRTVRLVDGGVHDNQGVQGLLDEGCTLVLCSDATGQMQEQQSPSGSLFGVPLRSSSILQARVRESEYQDLRGRVDSRQLQGLFFVHLKKDLESVPLDWVNCQDPSIPFEAGSATRYGVDKDIQRKLAGLRTDLDSFTEVEAYSLMLSGYLMTDHELRRLDRQHAADGEPGSWGGFSIDAPRGNWPFLALEKTMSLPPESSEPARRELGRQLAVGAGQFFKVWKLNRPLRVTAWCAGAVLLALAAWALYANWNTKIDIPGVSVGWLAFAGLVAMLSLLSPVLRWLKPDTALQEYAVRVLMAVAGFVLTNLHLRTFDRLFLAQGRLKRLLASKR
jgi:predicted acylesterase/phospholipase RssA